MNKINSHLKGDDQSSKQTTAESFTQEVRSWVVGNSEPVKDTFRCIICGFEQIGEENCVSHILDEHDAVLESELVMKN